MQKVINQPRSAGKTSSARAAVCMLRKAGYVWANGEWQAPFLTITVPDCDEDALRRAFANNKQGGRLLPYVEKYICKGLGQIGNPTAMSVPESEQLNELKAKTACCMGVGNGGGNLFVYGDYESIKAAQAFVLRAEAQAEVQAEPVALQMCSDLKPRTESEKAAYLAGVADGRMYAERDADTSPQAQPADALDAYLQEADQHLLYRFIETTEDDESFDIGKDAVKRLANLGVVESCGFGRYGVTMFGYWVHEHYWHQNPSLPLKTNADRDREHRAAMAAAQEGGAE